MKPYFLKPGEIFVTKEKVEVQTVLGSCVAICLHDPISFVSGMNHYLLPACPNEDPPEPMRYGSIANPRLLEEVLALGASRGRIQAKVFGGANVIADMAMGKSIGEQNAALAIQFLTQEKVFLVESDVGGRFGRSISFCTERFLVKAEKQNSSTLRERSR